MKTDDTIHQLNSKRTTPSADIKSKRDETVHKQINSNTDETSVNNLNYSKIRTTPSVNKLNYIKKRKTPSVKKEKNMQRAPSASDDTVHKQLLIPKRTTSVNKLTRVNYGRHHLLEMKIICRRHHLQGTTLSTNNY
jgi:hypothetical protein